MQESPWKEIVSLYLSTEVFEKEGSPGTPPKIE